MKILPTKCIERSMKYGEDTNVCISLNFLYLFNRFFYCAALHDIYEEGREGL